MSDTPQKRHTVRLTKRSVEALPAPTGASRDTKRFDSVVRGFGVRVYATGRRAFIFQYRNRTGAIRRISLGEFPLVSVETARENAEQKRAAVGRGEDPAENKAQERKAETFSAFSERWITRHAKPKKKDSSLRNDRLNLRLHLLPALGDLKLRDITRADVERLHDSMADKPTAFNRCLALLSEIMTKAEAWGETEGKANPCKHAARYPERKVTRPLSDKEEAELWKQLAKSDEAPCVVAALSLLLHTGCRLGEVRSLKWSEVDLKRAALDLADSKTGARTVYLSPKAVALLRAQPKTSFFVFPSPRSPKKPVGDLEHPWRRIREAAKLTDVRIHDLRHTFGARAISAGLTLHQTGKLLGHASAATTQRYAHLIESEQRAAVAQLSAHRTRAQANTKVKQRRAAKK
ncbi:MAG TPA: site-specific integrase [Candidatus Binatia bacterium]